jgi:trk system potassium uptake protein TrkH
MDLSAPDRPQSAQHSLRLRRQAMARILGIIIAASSLTKLPPALLALALREDTAAEFFSSFLVSMSIGLALWLPVRHVDYQLRLRDGFLIVTLTWLVASLVSALPFMYAPPHLSFTQAVFEAASGLTTTGATVITGLDALPKSVLFYRQVLHFVGGMGIVILSVAILPMLKIGGTQLFRAESTGLSRDTKLTPRIAETAKALWAVYAGLTVLCAGAYWVAGMGLFDAVCHAMSTLSTGGFANYDASFGHFDSRLLEAVAIVFMLIGGMNFGLHYVAWRRASMVGYYGDSELKAFLWIVGAVSLIVALILWFGGVIAEPGPAFMTALFQVSSIMTTTGLTTASFADWPGVAPLLVLGVALIGGCSGSTSGGIKVSRAVLLARQGLREVKQLVHPKGKFLVKLGGRPLSESAVISVSGFFVLWIACLLALILALNASGLDLVSAVGGGIALLTNAGPGLGSVSSTLADAPASAVWFGTLAMVMGRLEVFSVLVLLTPGFWRQ